MFGPRMQVEFSKGGTCYSIELGPPKDEAASAKFFTEAMNDNRVKQYLSMSNSVTESSEIEWIRSQSQKKEEFVWFVFVDGGLVGSIGLHRVSSVDRKAELGLVIGDKKFWGKGIAAVIEIAVVEFALNNVVAEGLNKIFARVYEGNIASRKALEEKVGFRTIGIRKNEIWCNGRWYDEWNGELLKTDWQKKKKKAMENNGIKKLDIYPGCEL